MARIKINIEGKKLAELVIPVRITDINYGNHVGNDSFVSILHEARSQWLMMYSFTEMDAGGRGLIMNDLAIEFKSESFYGDKIKIEIFCGEISKAGFELLYRLAATRNEKEIILANAKTGMICYDYSAKKLAFVPEKLLDVLQ